MQLTLLWRSKNRTFRYRIGSTKLLSVTVLLFSLLLISSRNTQLPAEQYARIAASQTGLKQQAQELQHLKHQTEQQLSVMLDKLKALQSRVSQVDALSTQLAEQAGLSANVPSSAPNKEVDVSQQDLLLRIETALSEVQNKQDQLAVLESMLGSHHIQQQADLSGRPIESGWLSSHFGMRDDPFTGLPAMHKGVDFAGSIGAAVLATGAGIVTWSGERYGYGNLVEINHGNGLVTRYGHNHSLAVKIGDVVTKGQKIAELGNTGRSTGAHVHYEVISKGQHINPLPFIKKPQH